MPQRVLVVGSINMDLIVRCPRIPREGETLHGSGFTTAGGGKGANQAVAASRLGARTTLIARLGEDEFGGTLRSNLERAGVSTEAIATDADAASGVALILLEETGHNRIIVVAGANARVGTPEVARARALLASSDVLLLQLEIPIPVVAEVAAAARERGVLTVLDAGPATPNESEAEALTGLSVSGPGDAAAAAGRLHELGARHVVLKLGSQGAFYSGPDGSRHVPGFPVQPIDTTAAGDAFTASLAIDLSAGMDFPEAVRRANAVGALACLKLGAQPSMPSSEELQAFLQANPL
jgi:ribokinase